VIVICTVGAWAFGYRLNLQTASIRIPAPSASPDDVVRAYVAAYNHRDFDTMNALYPGERRFHDANRHRALGTMSHVKIIDSRQDTSYGEDGDYWAVEVTLDYTHTQGTDISYPPGPNGWTYELEQVGPEHAWRIIDHGVG